MIRRPPAIRAWRLVLLLMLVALAGCATLRSQPRFREPGKPPSGGEQVKPRGKDKRKGEAAAAERAPSTKRRKDARHGGGLPVLRLFSHEDNDLIAQGEEYLGTPYRFGGDTERGMDCSGFVWRVFLEAWDVELPRNSAEMAQLGMPVSRAELQAGDLVFFATSGGRHISHVGIYGGDGRFIHSSTSQGVEWNTIEEGYWRRALVCARRVTPGSVSD